MLEDILSRIDQKLEALGLTESRAAKVAGLSDSAIRDMRRAIKNGRQDAGVSTRTLFALAPVLESSVEWLLTGRDEPSSIVSLVGHVGAGAEVEEDFEQIPEGGLAEIEVPFTLPADMVAFEVRGDSMLPMYDPGNVLIVYREQRKPLESYFGQRVIVRTDDGRRFVKTMIKGDGDTVSLISWNASPIQNVRVTWVGEIFSVFPSEQVRRVARQIDRQGGIQGQLTLKRA
ncbi:XRE family transcriptional regulator [Aliihoeflea sp. PC F10.4]